MIYKNLRRLYKPVHNYFFTKKIIANRKVQCNGCDMDVIVPDNRDVTNSNNAQQVKDIGLRILKVISELGKLNSFEFSLAYGTLLGAIRHDGFIPWDDDIDVFMTESDINKFISFANQLPEGLLLVSMDVGFFKVMDRSSIVSRDGKRGVAVDVFILKEKENELAFFNVHTLKWFQFPKSYYYPLRLHKFENEEFNVPFKFDFLLEGVYGEYMKLPPLNMQISPHGDDQSIVINSYGDFLVDPNNIK